MKQIPMFPAPPRPAVKPVVKRVPTSVRYTGMKNSQMPCDDCQHLLVISRGKAPVARMARWKAHHPNGEIRVLCGAHKSERVDVDEGSLR